MKNIQIKASQFFELLRLRDTSMWEVFAQMIDGEEKEIIFLDDKEKALFNYVLPTTIEKMEEDRKAFSKTFNDKLSVMN